MEENTEPIPLSSLKQKSEDTEKVIEVPIDIKKKQTDNKASVDVKSTGFIKDFVSEPTREPSDSGSSAPKSTETVEDIRKRLEQEEKEEVSNLKPEDFEDLAGSIIDLVDFAFLFGIRWYSQDISDAEYKVPEEKLKKIKKSLSIVLMKMGKKFPIGIILILSIVAVYATPIRKAHEHRKKVMAEKTRKRLRTNNDSSSADGEDEEPKYVPLKKKRGGHPK